MRPASFIHTNLREYAAPSTVRSPQATVPWVSANFTLCKVDVDTPIVEAICSTAEGGTGDASDVDTSVGAGVAALGAAGAGAPVTTAILPGVLGIGPGFVDR